MVHHKETSRKNEWIQIRNGDGDEILIDFGNDEVVPTIWLQEGKKSKDEDLALFPIFTVKQIDELIFAFTKLKKVCNKRIGKS